MTDAEAARWHGRTLRLDRDLAATEGSRCEGPEYVPRTVARDSLLGTEYHLPPGALPALDSAERLTVLQVRCAGSPWTAMGGRLIAAGSMRAFAPWDGVFFELERVTVTPSGRDGS